MKEGGGGRGTGRSVGSRIVPRTEGNKWFEEPAGTGPRTKDTLPAGASAKPSPRRRAIRGTREKPGQKKEVGVGRAGVARRGEGGKANKGSLGGRKRLTQEVEKRGCFW